MAADHRRPLSLTLASLALLLGLAALGTVLYLQFAGDIQPCSLCVYQRVADLAMLLAISIGFFAGRRWLWSLAALAALGGAALAGWQWHLANSAKHKVHACATIQLLPQENFASGSFAGTLASALAGQGSCAIAGQQRFWELPITHWSVAVFLLCALFLLLAVFFSARRR